jgi:uncharacterized membrane protein
VSRRSANIRGFNVQLFPGVACLLAIGLFCAPLASAAPPGTLYRDVIDVEGKSVPLPPGEWQLTGSSLSDKKLVSLALLRLRDGAADAAVLIQTNQSVAAVDWGSPAACGRTDLYYAQIRYATDHDNACAYAAYVEANPVAAASGADPAWRATLQRAAQSGWRVPLRWVVAALSLSDRTDALQVRYFFAPERAPAPAFLSPQGADQLGVWTRLAWDNVARGFRNRNGDAAPVPLIEFRPGGMAAVIAPPEMPQDESGAPGLGHIGLKTLTFRTVVTTLDFTSNLLFVGDVALAATMSAVGTLVGPVVFFLHELAWTYAETPAQRVLTLPGIGAEGPDPAVAGRTRPG